MPSDAKQRHAMLRKLFHLTSGDLDARRSLSGLAKELGLSLQDAGRIASQLAAQKLIKLHAMDTSGDGMVFLTVHGLEESERREKPLLQRWPSEHPALLSLISSVIGGLIVGFGKNLIDAIFK